MVENRQNPTVGKYEDSPAVARWVVFQQVADDIDGALQLSAHHHAAGNIQQVYDFDRPVIGGDAAFKGCSAAVHIELEIPFVQVAFGLVFFSGYPNRDSHQ